MILAIFPASKNLCNLHVIIKRYKNPYEMRDIVVVFTHGVFTRFSMSFTPPPYIHVDKSHIRLYIELQPAKAYRLVQPVPFYGLEKLNLAWQITGDSLVQDNRTVRSSIINMCSVA